MLPVFCLAAFLCASCGNSSSISGEENSLWKNNTISYMEAQPVIAYTVEEAYPNILPDRCGYSPDSEKSVLVRSKTLPDFFRLVDADTRQTVYIGRLQNTLYRKEQKVYIAEADFSSWTTEGNYYIECDGCGRSYPFIIQSGLYEQKFRELVDQVTEDCKNKEADFTEILRLLQAYEWYPELFTDENADGIPDALKAISTWTEAFREQEPAEELQADYATVLAKFSFLYQNYDKAYATECVKRASLVYDGLTCKEEEKFFPLTELYRATGLPVYGNRIAEYQSYFQNKTGYSEKELYGAMTYLCTRQKVEVSLCQLFADFIVESGENVGNSYRRQLQDACLDGETQIDMATVRILSCADYIANNYSYNQALESFAHYFGGANRKAECFYEEESGDTSEYLVLITQLIAVQEKSSAY